MQVKCFLYVIQTAEVKELYHSGKIAQVTMVTLSAFTKLLLFGIFFYSLGNMHASCKNWIPDIEQWNE